MVKHFTAKVTYTGNHALQQYRYPFQIIKVEKSSNSNIKTKTVWHFGFRLELYCLKNWGKKSQETVFLNTCIVRNLAKRSL